MKGKGSQETGPPFCFSLSHQLPSQHLASSLCSSHSRNPQPTQYESKTTLQFQGYHF